MNKNFVRMMALVASVAFAACGETTDLVLDELSEGEAAELASAVIASTFSTTDDVSASQSSGPAAVPFEFATEFEGEVECPLGGMVGIAASIEVVGDTESEAGHIEYAMTQVHDGCMATSEEGVEFTLWGNPDMNLAFAIENNGQGVVEWGGSVQGGLEWATEGRTGTCDVNMEFSGRQEGEVSLSGEFTGTVCGFQLTRTFSIG